MTDIYNLCLVQLSRCSRYSGIMVANGQLKPHVSAVLPLEEIQKAHAMIEARHTRGKIVIQVVQ